jgi:hypothetical protein
VDRGAEGLHPPRHASNLALKKRAHFQSVAFVTHRRFEGEQNEKILEQSGLCQGMGAAGIASRRRRLCYGLSALL